MSFQYNAIDSTVAEFMGAPASVLAQNLKYVVLSYDDGAMVGCIGYETTKCGLRVRWFYTVPQHVDKDSRPAIIRNFLRSRLIGSVMWVGMMIDDTDLNDAMWNNCIINKEKEGAKFRIWPNGKELEFRLCQPIFRNEKELGPLA